MPHHQPRHPADPDGVGIARAAVGRTALWVFIGVVCMLFFLFSVAYLMRMGAGDWQPLPAPPWQLWASTTLLALGSVAWHVASRASPAHQGTPVAAACAASLAFIGMQLWAWQAMSAGYPLTANPANSFFYLITGLHGLHVIGGLLAAANVWWRGRSAAAARAAGQGAGHGAGYATARGNAIILCARYWHFLLALWLAMYAMLFLLTPERFDIICNSFR
jgi:cytochrome c oxidase subunit 3